MRTFTPLGEHLRVKKLTTPVSFKEAAHSLRNCIDELMPILLRSGESYVIESNLSGAWTPRYFAHSTMGIHGRSNARVPADVFLLIRDYLDLENPGREKDVMIDYLSAHFTPIGDRIDLFPSKDHVDEKAVRHTNGAFMDKNGVMYQHPLSLLPHEILPGALTAYSSSTDDEDEGVRNVVNYIETILLTEEERDENREGYRIDKTFTFLDKFTLTYVRIHEVYPDAPPVVETGSDLTVINMTGTNITMVIDNDEPYIYILGDNSLDIRGSIAGLYTVRD